MGSPASREATQLRLRALESKGENVARNLLFRGVLTPLVVEQPLAPAWEGWWHFFSHWWNRDFVEIRAWELGALVIRGELQTIILLETGLPAQGRVLHDNRLRYVGPFEPEDESQIQRVERMLDALAAL